MSYIIWSKSFLLLGFHLYRCSFINIIPFLLYVYYKYVHLFLVFFIIGFYSWRRPTHYFNSKHLPLRPSFLLSFSDLRYNWNLYDNQGTGPCLLDKEEGWSFPNRTSSFFSFHLRPLDGTSSVSRPAPVVVTGVVVITSSTGTTDDSPLRGSYWRSEVGVTTSEKPITYLPVTRTRDSGDQKIMTFLFSLHSK